MLALFIIKLRFNFNKKLNIKRLKRDDDDKLIDSVN